MRRAIGALAVAAVLVGCGVAEPTQAPATSRPAAGASAASAADLTGAIASSAPAARGATGEPRTNDYGPGTSSSEATLPTGGHTTAADIATTSASTPSITTSATADGRPGAAPSTLRPPSTAAPVSRAAQANRTVALLNTLAVKGRAPKTGYDRSLFGPAWTDDVSVDGGHNGCDTRNDILRRDLTNLVIKPGSHGCTVLAGTLHDPYTGKTIDFTRGQATSGEVQIDHVVALMDAWQKGAQGLTMNERRNLANDPLNLQAVDGPTNAKKGAGDAATWLPPNKSYRCTYVSRQVQVKAKYHLWVTQAEKDAIGRVLSTCGGSTGAPAPVPSPTAKATTTSIKPAPTTKKASTATAPAATTKPAPRTTTTPVAKPGGCRPLSKAGNCYSPGQLCAKPYRGTSGVDAKGRAMKCVDKNGWRWVTT